MQFPAIPESHRLRRLEPPAGKVRMVLDTDTCNEVDDQLTWSVDRSRHFIRSASRLDRDGIFRDLFTKIGSFTGCR